MKLEWTDQHNFEIGECDSCGKYGKVVLRDDPKIASFYPVRQKEEKYWCRRCYLERQWSV